MVAMKKKSVALTLNWGDLSSRDRDIRCLETNTKTNGCFRARVQKPRGSDVFIVNFEHVCTFL